MATYGATVDWRLESDENFTDNRYSRAHTWRFDGGTVVPASSSPLVVPVPMSSTDAVDPEEAFVASLSSCHMLWFLGIAAKRGFSVTAYTDKASGTMARNPDGKMAMTRVNLLPAAKFGGRKRPTTEEIAAMHRAAHYNCYIAHSVTTDVICTPDNELL